MWQPMIDCGVVSAFLPQAVNLARLEALIAIETANNRTDPFRRLLALLPNLSSLDIDAIAQRLRLSGVQRKRLENAIGLETDSRLEDVRRGALQDAFYGADSGLLIDRILLSAAGGVPFDLPAILDFADRWQSPRFPLGGDALVELGLKPGPIFGQLLGEVERWWAANNY